MEKMIMGGKQNPDSDLLQSNNNPVRKPTTLDKFLLSLYGVGGIVFLGGLGLMAVKTNNNENGIINGQQEKNLIDHQIKEILLQDAAVITEKVYQKRTDMNGVVTQSEFIDTLAYVVDATKIEVLQDMNQNNTYVQEVLDDILLHAEAIPAKTNPKTDAYVIAADQLQLR